MKKPETLAPHLAPLWDELVDEFAPRIGASGMAAVCGQVYQMRAAQDAIKADGVLVQGTKEGQITQHPAIALELSAQASILRWREKFGTIPGSMPRAVR